MDCKIRPMMDSDIASVHAVQSLVYHASLLEDSHFYHNRLALAPEHCWVAEKHHAIVGYLISYPWAHHVPPPLNTPLEQLPDDAACWFIHDCAVAPKSQGCGVSAKLLSTAAKTAAKQGLTHASLVALADATDFWHYQGYRPHMGDHPALQQALTGYGEGTCYMMKTLQPHSIKGC
jgi:GNAT superfamily N-acetyltransferase